MNSQQYPIKDTFVYSPLELAAYLESAMGKYLIANNAQPPFEWAHNRPQPPVMPVLGLEIISTYIGYLIEETSVWSRRAKSTFNDVMHNFIVEEWRYTPEVFEHLRMLLIDVRTDVKIFLGNDPWIMHFVQVRGMDIHIQKSIDYRIVDWQRRMENGEWGSSEKELSANEQSLRDEEEQRRREDETTRRHSPSI